MRPDLRTLTPDELAHVLGAGVIVHDLVGSTAFPPGPYIITAPVSPMDAVAGLTQNHAQTLAGLQTLSAEEAAHVQGAGAIVHDLVGGGIYPPGPSVLGTLSLPGLSSNHAQTVLG